MTKKDEKELIKELREQLILLKERNDELSKQLRAEGAEKDAVGIYRDDKGVFHKIVFKYNPETRGVVFHSDVEVSTSFLTASYRAKEHLEMNILSKI